MLAGEQVYLRKIELSDTDNIVKWRNSESVRCCFIYQELFTRESHMEWMKKKVRSGKVEQMVICEKNTDRPIGSCYLRDIDRVHQKAEYGLFIGEAVERGKGIGAEVSRLMLEYGFRELRLHKIYARVLADNVISLRSAERAGLQREGYCKDEVCIQGKFRDIVLLGILELDILQRDKDGKQ